jgi:protocatechuate 3,4-dioxygenase beta subunit
MHKYARASAASLLLLLLAAFASGQTPGRSEKEVAATIAGRVTLGGKPVPGVVVAVSPAEPTFKRALSARATTDEDGHYRLTGVAAGRYTIAPLAPALVVPQDAGSWQTGKLVTVTESEEVEGLNFALTRGGVITGRITDSQGRPVIAQEVNFLQVDERGHSLNSSGNRSFFGFQTDDRGIYRIYGLPQGRYLVSAGEGSDGGSVRIGYGGGFYPRTFHPNATEQSRAAIVEVTAGAETTGIDIVLGVASNSYTASGRIVDADTGKPIANVQFGHGAMSGNSVASFGWSGNRTNANGEFRIEGLTPGRYAAFMIAEGESETYSEPAQFEVTDEDVTGVEVKARRGSSISGVAIVEGTNDADVLARLSSLQVSPIILNQGNVASPRMAMARISADGSFRLSGLMPGKVKLWLTGMPGERKGFSVLRIERDGRVVGDAIEVEAGQQITGVRLVLTYGTGVIRGLVKIEGGELPDNMMLTVHARRSGDDDFARNPAIVDARRRFTIEGLSAGEYELELIALPSDRSAPRPPIAPVKQTVTVGQSGAVEITLTLNLSARDKDN